jgi:hypothetical protein
MKYTSEKGAKIQRQRCVMSIYLCVTGGGKNNFFRAMSEDYMYMYIVLAPILGSSDFDKIFENCFASCSFGMAKGIQDYFRKRHFS